MAIPTPTLDVERPSAVTDILAADAPPTPPFLPSVHRLRAVAIAWIVAAHVWRLPSGALDDGLEDTVARFREGLTHNATLYFVFVSGLLLFHLADRYRGNARGFFRSRTRNVLMPYVVVSIVLALLEAVRHDELATLDLPAILEHVVRGTAQFHLWYIPFLVAVYVVSPVLLRLGPVAHRTLALVLLPLPLVVSRTGIDITLAQYAYFLPADVLGGLAGRDLDRFVEAARRSWTPLLSITLVTGAWLLGNGRDPHWVTNWLDATESVFWVHRMGLVIIVLVLLRRWDERPLGLADVIARTSFAVYFLHIAVHRAIRDPFWRLVPDADAVELAASAMLPLINLALTVALAVMLRRVLGRSSRQLIGA